MRKLPILKAISFTNVQCACSQKIDSEYILTGQIFDIHPHSASSNLQTRVFHLSQMNFASYEESAGGHHHRAYLFVK